jgi:hypothetical protein
MLTALSARMAFCHSMQMPPRLNYTPALWSRVRNIEGTYRPFGPTVGASIEGGALITAVVLPIFVRARRPAFALTLIGAACMVAVQVAWWLFVFPVKSQMVSWTPESLPANFTELRDQWEYPHAARHPADRRGRATRPLRSSRDPDETRYTNRADKT